MLLKECSVTPIRVASFDSVPSAFPVGHPHSGGGYHIPFPPAVSSEVLFAGRSCGRRVRSAPLSVSR